MRAGRSARAGEDSPPRRRERTGDKRESGDRGQEFGDLKPQASSLPSPQTNTDRTGKPDLTRVPIPSGEEGPGGVKKAQRASSRFHRDVAPVHVRDGLAVRCAADGVSCAGANRVDTTRHGESPVETRLAGVATLPAPEHSAGAFLFGWLHREVRLLPSLASLCRSTDADISQMPL